MTIYRVYLDSPEWPIHRDVEAPDPWAAKRLACERLGGGYHYDPEGPLVIATPLRLLAKVKR